MKSFLPSNLRAPRSLAILAAIIFPTTAQAILDTNDNLLSDLWEKQHNNGNLFPPTILAENDEDLDGWTNAQEAEAGTDPFNPNPPDGIVTVTITPSLTAGAFTLTWPTLVGKNYQLKVSTDLLTWTDLGAPITTLQTTHSIGINTTEPDTTIPPKVFWRVEVTDLDSDLDGLTNSEELNLGTDPFNPDTDGDDLSDFIELEIGTDPLNFDSDNNGVPDSAEDTDGDGIKNSEDAGPADNIVNWQKTGRPSFAVIEIAVQNPDGVHYVDHSTSGTILLRRLPINQQSSAVIIDKQQNVREKDFIWVTHLHDDLVPLRQNTDTSDDSLYDPLTDTYLPWNCPTNYQDSIADVRDGLVIGKYWLMQTGMDERLSRSPDGQILPGQEQNISVHWASIDRESNIASVSHYWKKEANGSYTAQNYSTAHMSEARAQSAEHRQTIAGVEKKWTLVARPGTPGLQISQDGGAFTSATKRFGIKSLRAVTRQGWIIDEKNRFWTGDKWETLLDILGQDYTEAELLGINDNGLAVAKIKKSNGPLKIGLLLPVNLISDLNNDGRISAADKAARDAAMKSDATDMIKDKGTEFMFHNDALSNGLWDVDDPDSSKPENAYDDDAEPLLVDIEALPVGSQIWLDHPSSDALKFYRDRKCTQEILLSSGQRFVVGGSVAWPSDNMIYVRAEGEITYPDANPQCVGDLVLKIQLYTSGSVIDAEKMKLTVVKELGATKYFHSIKDYIHENNTQMCAKDIIFDNLKYFRFVGLDEKLATVSPLDIFDHNENNPRIRGGLPEIITKFEHVAVTSANYCWSTDITPPQITGAMTNRCEGRIVIGTQLLLPTSSDTHHELGGILGTYFGTTGEITKNTQWKFGIGPVPTDGTIINGMGGFSRNYTSPNKSNYENIAFGRGKVLLKVKELYLLLLIIISSKEWALICMHALWHQAYRFLPTLK